MDLDEYQRGALRTAAARDKRNELLHLVLGLVGESGEIAEKFKKWVRDLDSDESLIITSDSRERSVRPERCCSSLSASASCFPAPACRPSTPATSAPSGRRHSLLPRQAALVPGWSCPSRSEA